MQAESNAESFCSSFLHYFQHALSNHLHVFIHTSLKNGRYRQILLYVNVTFYGSQSYGSYQTKRRNHLLYM